MKLSAVITSHNEGKMLRTAAISVLKAFSSTYLTIKWTHSRTIPSLEFIIVLDKADESTRQISEGLSSELPTLEKTFEVTVLTTETEFGEPGSARNSGVLMATGDLILLLDADDLVGKQFLAKSVNRFIDETREASLESLSLALHPELLMYFGSKTIVWRQPSAEEYINHRFSLLRANLWDVTVIAPRHVLVKYPFVASNISNGEGYEDWEWSLYTSLCDIKHDVIANSFCYKRAKRTSRLTKDNYHKALIPTDRISLKQHS